MTLESSALVLAWIAIVLLGLGLAGVLRQVKLLLAAQTGVARRVGPRTGTHVGDIAGLNASGTHLLLFADIHCDVCDEVIQEFLNLADPKEKEALSVLFRGPASDTLDGVQTLAEKSEVFARLGINATPFAVLTRQGVVERAEPVGSARLLREFAARAGIDGEDSLKEVS